MIIFARGHIRFIADNFFFFSDCQNLFVGSLNAKKKIKVLLTFFSMKYKIEKKVEFMCQFVFEDEAAIQNAIKSLR